jgi:hypothetical protein
MAEFCTKCHADHGFGGDPGINVEEMFSKLDEGYMTAGFICEGCGIQGIAKQNEKCLVAREMPDGGFIWDPYED